ncbi:MAG: TetR/AcrR family transcriptional regulator [Beutenbergiaceae bacterium]
MPKISDRRRLQRREQILNAAMACAAREGFHRTTMADVIAASGLSAGAVYGYFASKEDLILALADRAIGSIEPVLDELLAQDPCPSIPQAVRRLTQQIEAISQQGPDLVPVAIAAWAEAARNAQVAERVSRRLERLRGSFTALARTLQQQGRIAGSADPVAIGRAAAGAIPGYLLQRLIFADVEPSQYAAGLAALAGRGESD